RRPVVRRGDRRGLGHDPLQRRHLPHSGPLDRPGRLRQHGQPGQQQQPSPRGHLRRRYRAGDFGLCLPRHRPDSWRYLHGHHALRRQRWVRGCLRPAQDHSSEGVMARRRFGVDLTSLVWTTTDIDDNLDVVKLVRHADNITVWNDREGGEQITDLTSLNGTPLTDGIVQSDAHGMFAFYGPDTDPPTVEVWIDAGLGARQLAVATDLGPEYVSFSSRIDEVEASIEGLDLEAVEGLVEDVADLQGDVGDLESSLSSLSDTVSSLSGTVSSLGDTVSGLSGTVSGLNSTVSGHTS